MGGGESKEDLQKKEKAEADALAEKRKQELDEHVKIKELQLTSEVKLKIIGLGDTCLRTMDDKNSTANDRLNVVCLTAGMAHIANSNGISDAGLTTIRSLHRMYLCEKGQGHAYNSDDENYIRAIEGSKDILPTK